MPQGRLFRALSGWDHGGVRRGLAYLLVALLGAAAGLLALGAVTTAQGRVGPGRVGGRVQRGGHRPPTGAVRRKPATAANAARCEMLDTLEVACDW